MAASMPSAGDLTRRVTLRLWTDVPNGVYGLNANYSAGVIRWAKVEPIHGLALRYSQPIGEAPTHLVWLRWGAGTQPTDITAAHVIEFDGRRLRVIDAIDLGGLRRFTRVTVKDIGGL